MANRINLKSDPVFIADKLYYTDKSPLFKYKAALGIEKNCSYYTSALIIEGNPQNISDQDIDELREALAKELEKSKGE
jgi:hypothetical protein